jgi:hypothetical protein
MGAPLGECSQCGRPAFYVVGPNEIPLCIQCGNLHQQVLDRQNAESNRQIERALDEMEMITGVRMRPRRQLAPTPVVVTGATFHNISVNNSTVGVVNSGHLHQVDSSISAISGSGDGELAKAFATLTSAVMQSAQLGAEGRKEIVAILSALTAEGMLPKEGRRPGVMRPLMSRLRELLGAAADVTTVVTPLIPVIATALGIS